MWEHVGYHSAECDSHIHPHEPQKGSRAESVQGLTNGKFMPKSPTRGPLLPQLLTLC